MSEMRESVRGKPRTWVAVGLEERQIKDVEGKPCKLLLVIARIKGGTGEQAKGIFRMDEWRQMKVVPE